MGFMLWEGKPLRDVTEADIRQVVESGLEEHMQLEYKSELYKGSDNGKREFLLDVCMFANANGGILLIGIPERRDEKDQPTGAPDPTGVLGIEIDNPGAVLATYDASVTDSIEERLPLESAPIQIGDTKRVVLVIRVPNSTKKPHSVRREGHIYFPSRRERQRYPMTVREIKEMAMRTAGRLEQGEEVLRQSLFDVMTEGSNWYFVTGMLPVFFEDFLVDVRATAVRQALATFGRTPGGGYANPVFTFRGIERIGDAFQHRVMLWRNGVLSASSRLPMYQEASARQNHNVFIITAIDTLLRHFVLQTKTVYDAAGIGSPYLLSMMLHTKADLTGGYGGADGFLYHGATLTASAYTFPFVQIDDLSDVDRVIRPLCDQAHQMFGIEGSPCFDHDGRWIGK